MSQHLPENQRWNVFLNAATNSKNIQVIAVTPQEITFTTNDHSALNAFNDSKIMKSKIIHAISSQTNETAQNTLLNEHAEQLSRVLSYTGNEIIAHLVDTNFLDSHGISMDSNKCSDNPLTKIITCKLEKEGTKTVLFKQEQINFGFLQSMLREPKELAEILIENKPVLTEESFTGEDSSFGQDVLKVIELDKSHAEVKFNYGLIKHSIQDQYSFGAPVIYSSEASEDQFIIDRTYLLSYMYEIFPSGAIFTPAANGKLQPIMFQPINNNVMQSDSKTSFELVLDRSGSMDSVFPEYKQKITSIVTQITDNTKNWQISITAFDSDLLTKEFDSINSKPHDITTFISNLPLGGYTHLYDAMHNRISHISKLNSGENAVVIVFTDGANNGGQYDNNHVTNLAYNLREANPQFAMYTMGYGAEYTDSFFKDMASNGGFTHLHLGDLNQIDEFNQYVNTINNCKVIYSFENGSAKFFEQCAEGDIAISSSSVTYGTTLKIAGDTYSIGVEADA